MLKPTALSVQFYAMYNMEVKCLTSVPQPMSTVTSFGVPWDCLHSLHYKLPQGSEDDAVFPIKG